MAKKKFTIPYFALLLVTFTVLVAGIVITAVLGINLGFKEAGGTELRIDLNSAIQSQAKVVAEDVLGDNGIAIDSIIVEDKETTSYLVVRIADKSIANIDTIKTQIASKLGIETTSILSSVVKSTIKNDVYLAIGLVIVGLILAVLLFGIFRYRVAGGLALAFTYLVQIMFTLSIVFITRIQLSLAGIIVIIVSALLAVLFASIMLEKYRAQTLGKSLDDGEENLIMTQNVKSTLEPFIFVTIGIAILAVFMMFIGVYSTLMLSLVTIVSLASLAFSVLLILPKTNITLAEISRIRLEAHLSKNNSPAPAKNKTKK